MAKKKEPKEDKKEEIQEKVEKETETEDIPEETGENIVEEEKAEEAESKEHDYNSIFDDDYVEEKKPKSDEAEETEKEEEVEEVESEEEDTEEDESEPEPEEKGQEEPEEEEVEEEEQAEKEKPQQKEVKSKNKKSKGFPIKTAIIVLLAAALLVLGGYLGLLFFKSKNEKKEETRATTTTSTTTQEEKKTEKVIYINSEGGLNMRKEPDSKSEVIAVIPNGTKLTVLEEKESWYKTEYKGEEGWIWKEYTSETNPLVYQNKTYGFEITFPDGWSSYKVLEKNVDNGDGTTSPVLYVGIKSEKVEYESTVGAGYVDMFAISVYTPESWKKAEAGEGPKPAYLAQNTKNVFAWSPSQAGTEDTSDEREQMTSILKTFKIL